MSMSYKLRQVHVNDLLEASGGSNDRCWRVTPRETLARGGAWRSERSAAGPADAISGWLIRWRRRPLRVGLTGNIGSGKSAVARVWERLGAVVIDADELARLALLRGSPGYDAVRRHFGEGVLRPDGDIDRAALRRQVFADAPSGGC
jgi:hypothetical protein